MNQKALQKFRKWRDCFWGLGEERLQTLLMTPEANLPGYYVEKRPAGGSRAVIQESCSHDWHETAGVGGPSRQWVQWSRKNSYRMNGMNGKEG